MLASIRKRIIVEEVKVVKAIVIKKCVKLAMEKGYQKMRIEADCKNIIEELNGNKRKSSWKIDSIVNSIKEIKKNTIEVKFGFVKRITNGGTHRIA